MPPVNSTLPVNPEGVNRKFKVPDGERLPLLYLNASPPPPLIVIVESTLMESYADKVRVLRELHERGASMSILPVVPVFDVPLDMEGVADALEEVVVIVTLPEPRAVSMAELLEVSTVKSVGSKSHCPLGTYTLILPMERFSPEVSNKPLYPVEKDAPEDMSVLRDLVLSKPTSMVPFPETDTKEEGPTKVLLPNMVMLPSD